MNTKTLTCPNCGSTNIYEDDCIEIENIVNGLREWYVGYCNDCGKTMNWDKVYIFDHYEI